MSYVGIDPDKATELKGRLDRACDELSARAATVAALLAQGGIQGSQAPAELRDVAAWANYRSRDLQKRIERARAADLAAGGGARAGFRFVAKGDAKKAGEDEAKTIKRLIRERKFREVEAELDYVRQHASDVDFAAGFLGLLGPKGFAALVQGLKRGVDYYAHHREEILHDLAPIAALLATVTKSNNDADKKLARDLLAELKRPEHLDALAALLSFGGFASSFTADAARALLGVDMRQLPSVGIGIHFLTGKRYRDIALEALDKDPEAAYLFVTRASSREISALLDGDNDLDDGALAAKILRTGLVEAQGKPGHDPKLLEDSLERLINSIAKGDHLSDAARVVVATALRTSFANGHLVAQLGHPTRLSGPGADDFNVSNANLQKCFGELMKYGKSREELANGISEYLGAAMAESIRTGEDLNETYKRLGTLLGVVKLAARDYIDRDNEAIDFWLTMLRTSGHVAVGVLSKYTGPAAPVVGAAGNYGVDKGVGAIEDGQKARVAFDKAHFDEDMAYQVEATLAQIYYALPEYRAKVQSPLPPELQDKNGDLKSVTPGTAEMDALEKWLRAKENKAFADALAKDQLALNGWVHEQLLLGK